MKREALPPVAMPAMTTMPAKQATQATQATPGLAVRPLSGRWNRLGLALHFVGRLEPFASFRSADLVNTLSAQIEREHCLFALDGARVVGYIGWAMYDAAVAAPFARGAAPPPNALAQGHDVTWILTAVAAHPAALMTLVRALRALYPGTRLMGVRHKSGGRRVVFDRAARLPVGSAAPEGVPETAPMQIVPIAKDSVLLGRTCGADPRANRGPVRAAPTARAAHGP